MNSPPCRIKNGGCSHLCLLAPQGRYKCACPNGLRLKASDNMTCEGKYKSTSLVKIIQIKPVFFPSFFFFFRLMRHFSRFNQKPNQERQPQGTLAFISKRTLRKIKMFFFFCFLFWLCQCVAFNIKRATFPVLLCMRI